MRKLDGNDVIKDLRDRHALTQQRMADESNLTEAYISQLETGLYLIGAEAALKIWDTYGPELSQMGYGAHDLLRGEARAA